jgi:hypothetical protein
MYTMVGRTREMPTMTAMRIATTTVVIVIKPTRQIARGSALLLNPRGILYWPSALLPDLCVLLLSKAQ